MSVVDNYDIKDSGVRQEFETGSVRDSEDGKGRHDLISPLVILNTPHHNEKLLENSGKLCTQLNRWLDAARKNNAGFLEPLYFALACVGYILEGNFQYLISPKVRQMLALHMQKGADKYDERNWEKGQKLQRMYSSAQRHWGQYQNGETDENHLAAVAWNIHGLIHTIVAIREGMLPESLNDIPLYLNYFDEAMTLDKMREDYKYDSPDDELDDPIVRKPAIYISGKMRGLPDFNHPTFNLWADEWRKKGWRVFNPAENDMDYPDASMEDRFKWDFNSVVNECDAIALIEHETNPDADWKNSNGARAEAIVARLCGLSIFTASAPVTANYFGSSDKNYRVTKQVDKIIETR